MFLFMHNLNANLVLFTLATALCSIFQHYHFCQVAIETPLFNVSQSVNLYSALIVHRKKYTHKETTGVPPIKTDVLPNLISI